MKCGQLWGHGEEISVDIKQQIGNVRQELREERAQIEDINMGVMLWVSYKVCDAR